MVSLMLQVDGDSDGDKGAKVLSRSVTVRWTQGGDNICRSVRFPEAVQFGGLDE